MPQNGLTFNAAVRPDPQSTPKALGQQLLQEVSGTDADMDKILNLIGRGASLEERDAHDSTPLMVAARSGNAPVAEALIQYGAAVNATDREGSTALILATIAGSVRIVKALASRMENLDHLNMLDRSALMWAAALGRGQIAQVLMTKGADVHLQNHAGHTAVDLARMNEQHSLAATLQAVTAQLPLHRRTAPARPLHYRDIIKGV